MSCCGPCCDADSHLSRSQNGEAGREGTRPRLRGERVLSRRRYGSVIGRASLMIDVQVTLSPSWIIKPVVESTVSSLSARRRVSAASSSYLEREYPRRGLNSVAGRELPLLTTRVVVRQWPHVHQTAAGSSDLGLGGLPVFGHRNTNSPSGSPGGLLLEVGLPTTNGLRLRATTVSGRDVTVGHQATYSSDPDRWVQYPSGGFHELT